MPSSPLAEPLGHSDERLFRRISRRLLPIVAICHAIAIVDRVNVGYAKLTMSADIGLSVSAYGLGAGVFFIAYCLLEVPSNVALQRVGARLWITRIMVTWGLVAMATALVQNTWQFYLARFLLGAAEAGFYPGVVYFLSTWFPRARLSRALAVLAIAGPVGNIVVGPLSGWILSGAEGLSGAAGWRWLFLLHGVPAVVVGVVFWFVVADTPARANWLTPTERQRLTDVLDVAPNPAHGSVLRSLHSRAGWAFGLLLGANYLGVYGVIFWLPTLVAATGVHSTVTVGLLSAIPWATAVVVTLVVGSAADRTGAHRAVFCVGMLVAAVGFLVSVHAVGTTSVTLAGTAIATAAFSATGPLPWVLARRDLAGTAAAFGLVNAVASIGSFLGPYVLGLGTDLTGSTKIATTLVAGVVVVAALSVPLARRTRRVADVREFHHSSQPNA